MRVFITGGTGFIGQATIHELLTHKHTVLGLARSDTAASTLQKAGVETIRGDLENLSALAAGAKACDGVIHLAFIHDFSDFPRVTEVDRAAITAIGDAVAGTNKPLIIASGTLGLPKGVVCTEETEAEHGGMMQERALSADLVYEMAKEKGVRGQVIRFAPTVHGEGDKGLIPMMMDVAKKNGYVTYIGEGQQRWNAVHRRDAAVLLRLAIEKGRAGATYHAVAEEGVVVKEIMKTVGKGLGLDVVGKGSEEAGEVMGFLGFVFGMDNPVSSAGTRSELGWVPREVGLLEDLEGNYFR